MLGRWFDFRKISPMYLLGLLFLFFPIYYAYVSLVFLPVLLASLGFAWFYLSILLSKSPLYVALAWVYLLGYIAYFSLLVNPQFSLFLFNLSNLLTWHFDKDRLTYRTVSYALLLVIVLLYVFMGGFVLEVKVAMVILHGFGVSMMVFGRLEQRTLEAERKVQVQAVSVNRLLAENERQRISRDLHDTLGHVFAMMTIKTELALKQLDKGEVTLVGKELRELHQISRQSMSDVRQIINNLSVGQLKDELTALSELFAMTSIELTVDNHLDSRHLSPKTQSLLIMLLRELTNNVIKHSQASYCRLLLKREDRAIILECKDDGVGFQTLNGQELISIRERLVAMSGQVTIVSQSQPTVIRVVLMEGEE